MLFRSTILILFCVAPFLACASPGGGAPASGTTRDVTAEAPLGDAPLSFADWNAFADRIREAGRLVEAENVPVGEIERAEGYRYLLAMLSESILEGLYQSDLEDPQLRVHITKWKGEAMPSSDARYQRAEIDGNGVYRISGQLGNAAHITLQAYAGVGARETFDLEGVVDEDGRFAIVIGGEPQSSNWMAVSADAEMIQFREYFGDWEAAEFSHLFIERIDQAGRGVPTTARRVKQALARAVLPLYTRVPFWKQRMDTIRASHDNSLSAAKTLGDVGLGGLYYGDGWFDLDEDEALVIEFEAPVATHWSFQLGNYWAQTMDWANFTSSTNGDQARPSSDGLYRLVIARKDPGVPNWLDTAGHREGVIVYRYHKPESNPLPTTRLVKLSKLRSIMPADTPEVTAEERAAEVARRRDHKRRRWQP